MSPLRSRSQKLHSIESPQIRSAGRVLLESIATNDEKLQAIEFLKGVPTAEAFNILKECLEEELYSAAGPGDRTFRERPRAGQVARAVARGLVTHGTAMSFAYLRDTVSNTKEVSLLRETIAYGLGGSVSREALDILVSVVKDGDDSVVLHQVILSIKEFLDASSTLGRAETQAIVRRLAELLKGETWKTVLVRLNLRPLVKEILVSYCSEESVSILLEMVVSYDELESALFALDILGQIRNEEVGLAMVTILEQGSADTEVLKNLGVVLARGTMEAVRLVAQKIVDERPTLLERVSNLLPANRDRLHSRREAALRIVRS